MYNHTEHYDNDDSANDGDNDTDDDDDGRLPRWRTTKYWTIIPSRSNSPPQVSRSSFLFKRKIFILILLPLCLFCKCIDYVSNTTTTNESW